MTGASGTCLNLRSLLHDSTSTRSISHVRVCLRKVLSPYPASKQAYKAAGIFEKRVKKEHAAQRARCTDCLNLLHPPADKNPFREWNMWDGTASRDNSELCLSSSRRPALPPSRASPFVNLARIPGLRHSSMIPDSFPVRFRCVASPIHDPVRLDSSLKISLNSFGEGESVSKRW